MTPTGAKHKNFAPVADDEDGDNCAVSVMVSFPFTFVR